MVAHLVMMCALLAAMMMAVFVDIGGIDDHHINDIKLATGGAVVQTQRGPIVLIVHQYAAYSKGRTVHAPVQWEAFKNQVDDKSVKASGKQCVFMLDGYAMPINTKNGLPYIKMHPFSDHEWDTLPHAVATGDNIWDPSSLDHNQSDDDAWCDTTSDPPDGVHNEAFDEVGDCHHRTALDAELHYFDAEEPMDFKALIDHVMMSTTDGANATHDVNAHEVKVQDRDWESIGPCLAWAPIDVIKKTFDITTQFARLPANSVMKK